MLLALWFDFWNASAWVPGPPPVIPTQPPSSGGHGHGKPDPYGLRAGDDYWEAKAEMLRRHMPIEIKAAPPPVAKNPVIKKLVQQQNRLVRKIPIAENMIQLQRLDQQLQDISIRIDEFNVYSDEDALLALLLS